MGRLLTLIIALMILNGCLFQDFGKNDSMEEIDLTYDSISFDQFAMVEFEEGDVYYNKEGNVSVTFLEITQDSRCPLDVECVWAGSVTAKLELHEDDNLIISANLSLPGENNFFIYKNTYFRLVKVDPYPEKADVPISDYTITMEIKPEGSECQSAIIDTDLFNNPWGDDFIFEDVQIEDGSMLAKIRYGGGCGTIQYELVSDGIFTNSDPKQINLLISFKDEDECEALVSTTLCFDLSIFQSNPDGETIDINLNGWDTPLIYSY